jgi:hypothetical protein
VNRRLIAALTGLALIVSITGCSTRGGAAAVIDGQRISESEVAAIVTESQTTLRELGITEVSLAALPSAVVTWLLRARILDRIAQEEGLEITDGEVDEVVSQAEQDLGREELQGRLAAAGVPPTRIREYARSFVVQNKITQQVNGDEQAVTQLLVDYSRDFGVEVSPRYGAWDAASGALVASPDELSRPEGPGTAAIFPKS